MSWSSWSIWLQEGSLGLRDKNAKICFLGCDNAGKTTLLQMLREGRLGSKPSNPPTLYPTCEELIIGSVKFRTFDLGGHETARSTWRDYCASADGIIFFVDAADRTRFQEAREELKHLLEDPALAEVPIVVLGNKIDIPEAASEQELQDGLRLYQHMRSGKENINNATTQARPVELFMVSVVKRMGYAEAFQWLSRHLE